MIKALFQHLRNLCSDKSFAADVLLDLDLTLLIDSSQCLSCSIFLCHKGGMAFKDDVISSLNILKIVRHSDAHKYINLMLRVISVCVKQGCEALFYLV